MRLVEVFDSRSLFNDDITREQAFSAMNAAVDAEDELQVIARRLQAGPEEFLTLRVLSPDEEHHLPQQREAREEERLQPKTGRKGLQRLAEAVFGKGSHSRGVEEDLKVVRVQEFLTERKGFGRSTPP